MWEVARAVSQSDSLSVEEKTVLRKLAWSKEAWDSGLIQQLVSTEFLLGNLKHSDDLDDALERLLWGMSCSRMMWSGSFTDVNGSAYRLVVFQRPVNRIPPRSYPPVCIVMDDNNQSGAWEVVATECLVFENAAIRPGSPAVLTITCEDWFGRRGTYQYQVSAQSIEQLGEPTWEIPIIQ
jgi:hypothetical protein